MCISNIGNRRPFPSGNVAALAAQDLSLLNRVAVKNEFIEKSLDKSSLEPKLLVKPRAHITVEHNYHDHAFDISSDYQEEHPARGGVTTPFPLKLHEMLDVVVAEGLEHVVSWQPHGRCFVVHKPKEFVELLPEYFKLSKLASFQRQLNLYGFQRLTRGPDRGGYYHELFLREKVFLSHNIQRIKVKGTGVRARSNPDQEPDLWAMSWVNAAPKEDTPPEMTSSDHQLVMDKIIGQLPLKLPTPPPIEMSLKDEQDLVCAFGDKAFHFLDPFQPVAGDFQRWTVSGVDDLFSSEAEAFFEDFDFPETIGAEIEDDDVFGDLLEQMIA